MPVVTVRVRGITLERLMFKVAGGSVPGLVERTLDADHELAQASDELAVGTRITIPKVGKLERARTIWPVRLVDWCATPRIAATLMWDRNEAETLVRLYAWNALIHRNRTRVEKVFGT